MSLETKSSDRFRLTCIYLFQTLLFFMIILSFYKVQIVEGEKWEKKALLQHQKKETIPYKRGSFFSNVDLKKGSNEKQPFAYDIARFHLCIDPLKIPEKNKNEILENLLSIIDTDQEKQQRVKKDFFRKTHYRKLFSYLDRTTVDKVQKWWKPYYKKEKLPSNVLFTEQEFQRFYPFGSSLGQVLHTVLKEKDSKSKMAIPTGGLELYFRKLLEGKQGQKAYIRSARNKLDSEEILVQKEDGADVYLTINHYIQAICEEELERGVKNANAKGGWAVMMDPYTGEVLALAQYPFFDVTKYSAYFNDKELEEITRCKACVDTLEPASTMKPLTMCFAMMANEELEREGKDPIFSPDEKISTKDGKFPGIRLKDGRCHPFMNMDIALQKSANVYMGKIMERIIESRGEKWLRDKIELFGFGQKTGIELPAEASGLVPTPGKLHPNGTLEWSKPTPFSLAFGHNLLANTMQVAVCYSMLANDGYKVSPTLIKKIVKKNGGKEEVLPNPKKAPLKKILSSKITNRIKKSLKYVTKPGGSARRGDVPFYTEAGKSGSSEKVVNGMYSHELYQSLFAGFTPAEKPRFVLVVVMDEPERKWVPGFGSNHLGGVCSSPVFSKIAERTLRYLGVAPDDPFGYPKNDPRRGSKKADMIAEVNELNNLYKKWNSR